MDLNQYLGDGLYVDFDGYQIKLYASDGIRATDTVWLEPRVLGRFLEYVEELKRNRIQEAPKDANLR